MDRRLGRPLPHQLPNPTRADPSPINLSHPVSLRDGVSGITPSFPGLFREKGHVPTRYSPVRRSVPKDRARLACVKPAASVRSEPGSNSQVETRPKAVLDRRTSAHRPAHRAGPKRHRSSCIRSRRNRHPTNGEADTHIIGPNLMGRYPDVRPSKWNQTARISLHHLNMSKSEGPKTPHRAILKRNKLPEPLIFRPRGRPPPPVEGLIRARARAQAKNAGV